MLLIDQVVFDVISKVFSSPAAFRLSEVVDTVRFFVGVAAACVTFIVLDVTPVPLMVIVAVREDDVDVWASAVTVMVLLFDPEEDGENLSQLTLLFTFQFVVEVILKVFSSEEAVKLIEEGETVNVGAPACVTLMVFVVTPVPFTVIVAVREEALVLAVAVAVISLLLEPEDCDTVSQELLLVTVHCVLDTILKLFLSVV